MTTKPSFAGACLLALPAAALCLLASPAAATETSAASRLNVEVVGHISPSCSMGGGGDIDFGNLTRTGLRATAAVAFNCNMPFDLHLTSAHGGLANLAMPRGQGPYQGTLPYSLSIDVPVISPAARRLQASYSSEQLHAGQTLSSGEAIASGGATLRFEVASPTGAGLLAGDYSEIVEVTVTPRT